MSDYITLHEYIEMLQAIEQEHGGDIPVIEYVEDWEDGKSWYQSADAPVSCEDDKFYGKGITVDFDKAVMIA